MLYDLFKKYGSDKFAHGYAEVYDEFFEPYRERQINFLELGIWSGGSLRAWADYFTHPETAIVGVDSETRPDNMPPRVVTFLGRQQDTEFLQSLNGLYKGFDIIIDDCSHLWQDQQISFEYLWKNALNPGGLYVIEDLGTSFSPDFAGGYDLDTVKYLSIVTRLLVEDAPRQKSVESMHYYANLCLIRKRQ